MITQTEAIVLKTIKYGDSSHIVKVYTQDYGILSLIAASGGKKGKKTKSYFSALNVISVIIYYKEKQNLHRLKEVSYHNKNIEIGNHVGISAIKFFLAEVLNKLIAEEELNLELYSFLKSKIDELNQTKVGLKYFNINFLYEISGYLGIKPNFCEEGQYFDLRDASLTNQLPLHGDYIDGLKLELLKNYFCDGEKINKTKVSQILDILIAFYNLHLGGLDHIKSREVMEVVFS